jgi:hypothetical protein
VIYDCKVRRHISAKLFDCPLPLVGLVRRWSPEFSSPPFFVQKVSGRSGYNQKLELYRLENGNQLIWIDDVLDNICANHAAS